MDKLLVAERFLSLQGEGRTTGVPSYFIRLANCNLNCGSSPREITEVRKNPSAYKAGEWKGETHSSGQASWTCDSIAVWVKGIETDFQQIIDDWKNEGIYEDICKGVIHIIWTGGEPTLPKHQSSIVEFTKWWMGTQFYPGGIRPSIRNFFKDKSLYYEIETNGTVYIKDELFSMIDQINCSPKLSNSGNGSLRYNLDSLRRIMDHPNYQFKFVISKEEDLKEIFDEYINKLNIPLKNVYCMPGLDDRENFHERNLFVWKMAEKYRFIASTRLHVSCFDKLTGV